MLSMVNSSPHQLVKNVEWSPCITSGGDDIPMLNVNTINNTIVEGQQTNFTVSVPFGFLQTYCTASCSLYMQFVDYESNRQKLFRTPVCGYAGLPSCPIEAGTSFTVSISVVVPHLPHVIVVLGYLTDALGCAYSWY
ncbi:hypothetical protein C2G38_2162993 [Gigaspora rosea]|uniref:Phosphatidylglycerol/phosphatidylinositol transfer protein n=1 Tax=Gigaspora rosea TaxID=44941 RepID=A0A397W2T9_9GLOM|nr:hypothetical protein C2G38_2162993 [Gigaspora rosea]